MKTRPVLLVTGGSRGIGAATCRKAAQAGWDIAINYTANRQAAETVADACRAAGATARTIQADVSDAGEIALLFDEVGAAFGRLDGLVNNAGITGTSAKFMDASVDTVRSVIDLNVTGALLVAQAAARMMAISRGGHGGGIVNVSSTAATLGSPGEFVWYAASKGAIDSMTIGLAKELATEGIRVNAVAPGLIETDIHASSGDPDRLRRFTAFVPMARTGAADEVADAILYLLSNAASYVTGVTLRVSGGR
ncbi:MAG: SDR family oxidoreductase [Beijerinckiaceae bacterium]